MRKSARVVARSGVGLGVLVIAACAHAGGQLTPGATLAEGSAVMNRCAPSEQLVVENRTGYPVRVIATEGSPSPSIGSAATIGTVPSGTVDTLTFGTNSHRRLQFNVERPAFSNGQEVPITGLRAQCVRQS